MSVVMTVVACPCCALPARVLEHGRLEGTPDPVDQVRTACAAGHACRLPFDRTDPLVLPDARIHAG